MPSPCPGDRRHGPALALLTLLWALAGATGAHAAVLPYTFDQLVARSERILVGEVVGIRSYRGSLGGAGEVLFTDVTLKIEETLKGSDAARAEKEVVVQVLGGEEGGRFLRCLESAQYKVGEKALIFLREYRGRWWNTGWLQGKYALGSAGRTGSSPAAAPVLTVQGGPGLPVQEAVAYETVKASVLAAAQGAGGLSARGSPLRARTTAPSWQRTDAQLREEVPR